MICAETPPAGTVRDWLDRRAGENPDGISHIFPDNGSFTWSQLRDEAASIARHIRGMGTGKGDSVALMLPTGRDGVRCLFGALYGGFRVAIINLVAGAEAISYALAHSESSLLLLGREQQASFAAASAQRPLDITALLVDKDVAWPSGSQEGELYPIVPENDAILMYTSGTTGTPKGVLHTQASLLAGGWTTALAHELQPTDRAMCVLPIYHINGLCVTMIAPLVSGGSVVVCEKFSASRFWQLCAAHEVTWFSVVPTIISHLLHGTGEPDAQTRARIRFGRSASSALAVETQSAFENRFDIAIVETMGLTETAAQILSNPLPPGIRKIGSPGKAYGNEVKILSPSLTPLPPGLEGEIAVKGPNVMAGYFKNTEANAATFSTDGWLRTGDLGRMDEDGYVYVTGRLKELIIKGGENIAPREVDEALYSHPDIVEAAAFARPCTTYGERVEAAVKLRDGANVSQAALVALCETKLGKFKSPEIIHFMDELPKGPSGKIQRLKLAALTETRKSA